VACALLASACAKSGASPAAAASGPEGADRAGEADLVIYSSHPDELARVVVAEFRERTGLRVRLVRGGTGEMLARLRSEAEAGKGACDVFWGGGAESLAANVDLFEPWISSEDAAIPAVYKAADHRWNGFTVLPMVIAYNKRLLPSSRVPRSWSDLLEPYFRGSIAYADPEVSASSYTILRTIGSALSKPGGPARREVEAAFARALEGKVLGESAAVFPSVASGEYLVGIYHDEAAQELLIAGSDLKIVYPVDGTSAVPDGVALVKGCAHRVMAGAFIDFALGADVARVMGTRFHRRSVRLDSAPVPGQPALSEIPLAPYDVAEAAVDKAATLERFKGYLSLARGVSGGASGGAAGLPGAVGR
jgi:iron(III) transport system substrate-binding protein